MNKSTKTPKQLRTAQRRKDNALTRRSLVASIRQHLSRIDPALLAPDAVEAYEKLQEQLDIAHTKAMYNTPYTLAMRNAHGYLKVMFGFADLEKVERHRVPHR